MLWCVPFFFTNYNHTIYLTTTYMTSYGDVPAGRGDVHQLHDHRREGADVLGGLLPGR